MNKLRYLLVAVPLTLGAGAWLARDTQPAAAGATIGRPASLVAPGRVEPEREAVKLAFEGQGRIVEILVDEGSAVTAGQVLARLDNRLAHARVAAAEAALAQATARHALAQRGPRAEDVTAARAEADAAAASAAHRTSEQARSEQLGRAGAVADAIVEADSAAARVANAHASAASARFQSLARGTRAEQIQEAAAAVALARAEVDAAKVALDQMTLRAPHDGVILRRTAEVGTIVTQMAPVAVVTLADLRQLQIRAEIDEADVASVAVGQRAYATADAFGDRKLAVRIIKVTRELGRKTVRDDDPRARVDTRVLEVVARFDGNPGVTLPVGLRTSLHVTR